MATDDDDAATLRERVRELEQTVAQQQDTIQQLLPSRRAVLAGGAGLVGGAALTGQASAQSAAGQVGTSSEPVDVEAATVTADSVNTDDARITDQTNGLSAVVDGVIDVDTAGSHTHSFSDNYESVVIGYGTNSGKFTVSGGADLQIRINGHTDSAYRTHFADGSDVSGTEITLFQGGFQGLPWTGQIRFTPGRRPSLTFNGAADVASGSLGRTGSYDTGGGNDTTDSIEFIATNSQDVIINDALVIGYKR